MQGDSDKLLSIDRVAVTQTIDPSADSRSTYVLYGAYAYVVADSILSGVHDGRPRPARRRLLYAESISLTSDVHARDEMASAARGRSIMPSGEVNAAPAAPAATTPTCSSRSSPATRRAWARSPGTATYLAFMRFGRAVRPWITLASARWRPPSSATSASAPASTFPTDVIMGALAGAGIGVLVPHFHRRPHYHESEYCAPPVIIGFSAPAPGTGELTLNMRF